VTRRHLALTVLVLALSCASLPDARIVAGQDLTPPVWDPAVRAASLDESIARALSEIEAVTARKSRVESELAGSESAARPPGDGSRSARAHSTA